MKFFLGTHEVSWLTRVDVPLFVSAVRLRRQKALPRATAAWSLDSGGFNAIRQHGHYRTGPREYAREVAQWANEVGNLEWAAIQDWMCEPFMLEKTGMTVAQHQTLTVNSWIALNSIDALQPWVPVLQGWELDDYLRCADLYLSLAATDLTRLPLVGLGSVCRRQRTQDAARIVKGLYARGFHNLHGFGFKTTGLVSRKLCLANYLASSDSMAWSYVGRETWKRERRRLCGHEHRGGCVNCRYWALQWRTGLQRRIERVTRAGTQMLLF